MMNCPKCSTIVPEQARFCSSCGAALSSPSASSPHIEVHQDVGAVQGGEVAGIKVGQVSGDLTVESTVNHIETSVVRGTFVDARTITNNILTLGPDALDQIVGRLATMLGADKQMLLHSNTQPVPENVSRQIAEVVVAQKEVMARGVEVSPEVLYQLSMLAAYDRNYVAALDYLHQAVQANPDFSDAFFAIAWLQQGLANDDLSKRNYDAAVARLAEARTAAMHTDPLDARALAARGYVAKTLAQIMEARDQLQDRERYCQEAARLFEQAAKLDPTDPSAQNGLGNVQHMLGDLDAAIVAYSRAVKLAPSYTAAWHDLAIAYEAKMRADPAHAASWRKQALTAWRKTYALAPEDPGFSPAYIVNIGQRIGWLERQ